MEVESTSDVVFETTAYAYSATVPYCSGNRSAKEVYRMYTALDFGEIKRSGYRHIPYCGDFTLATGLKGGIANERNCWY